MARQLLRGLLTAATIGVMVMPSVMASTSCKPTRGGIWSGLAYPVPVAKYPAKTYLEIPAPNKKYKLVVHVTVYPKLTVFEADKPLTIVLPPWIKSPENSSNPRFVQSTGAEFMWAPDSRSFSATENYNLASPNIAGGGWRVLIYMIRPPHVIPIFVDAQSAAAYKKTFDCEYLPAIGALKWVTEKELLLIAEGSTDELCKNQRWLKESTRGYLVSVPGGRIIKTYNQEALAQWRYIFGSSGAYGRSYPHSQNGCSTIGHEV